MRVRRWVLSSLVAVGCAGPAPRPPPPPLVGATEAPDAGPKVVWTTESKRDECRAYPEHGAPPFARFDSREACDAWVKTRRCRPGFSCYNGCNTIWCSADGDHLATTLLSCELRAELKFEFPPASSAVSGSVKATIKEVRPALQPVLDDPTGTIKLHGRPSPTDGKTAAARKKLAEARTRAIRDLLVAKGIPAARLESLSDPEEESPMGLVRLVAHADEPHHECKEQPEP